MTEQEPVTDEADDRALSLRDEGKGYRVIAKTLGFAGASEANKAFNRALRRLPKKQRDAVRSREESRLDRLEKATQAHDEFSKDELERRLGAIARLRARLHAG